MRQEWSFFAQQQSIQVPVALVREFLANFPESDKPTSVQVRGVEVPISPSAIKEVYSFQFEGDGDHYSLTYANKHIERTRNLVAETLFNQIGKKWTDEKINHKQTCKEAQVWGTFIRARLLPVGHVHLVTWKQAVAIHCILADFPFYTEEVLYESLCAQAQAIKGTFQFPCLVKLLCDKAGVPMSDDDTLLVPFPTTPFDEKCLARIVKKVPRLNKRDFHAFSHTGSSSSSLEEELAELKMIVQKQQEQLTTQQAKIFKLYHFNRELMQYLMEAKKRDRSAFEFMCPHEIYPEIPSTLIQDPFTGPSTARAKAGQHIHMDMEGPSEEQ